MDSNYEAQKHLTQQRLAGRYAQADAERLLQTARSNGAGTKPSLIHRLLNWLRRKHYAASTKEGERKHVPRIGH